MSDRRTCDVSRNACSTRSNDEGSAVSASLVQVLARRQDVLECAVVQLLGEGPAFPALDRRQRGDQLVAVRQESPDSPYARLLYPGQQDTTDADAGQCPVRRRTDDHGSPFADLAAMLEPR